MSAPNISQQKPVCATIYLRLLMDCKRWDTGLAFIKVAGEYRRLGKRLAARLSPEY